MKRLALLAAASAHAQLFGPRAANGALIGGIAGAVIGHNSGSLSHNGWQGAAKGWVAVDRHPDAPGVPPDPE